MRFLTTSLAAILSCAVAAQDSSPQRPNFIVFLTDDQGWGDLGCYDHPRIQSPNLDRLATQSVRFTQCYSACGVCSPSRSAILTGRTPYRNGVWRWIPSNHEVHLRESEITLPELLGARGYSTCHVGKWHLNGKFNSDQQPQPDDHGYQWWFATQNNASPSHENPTNFVRNGEKVGPLTGISSVLIVEEAIAWLKEHRDEPFFLTVWTHEPHLPIESAPEYMAPYADIEDPGIRQHHGNITQLDAAFGKLSKALDELGLADNTCLFYTSDNGPEGTGLGNPEQPDSMKNRTRGSTGGLRGRKRADYEGGIRVPGMVRWPAYFRANGIRSGTTSDIPVIGSDIFTTICSITGIPLPDDRTIDGADMLPALRGDPVQRSQPLYWRTHIAPPQCRVAMRINDWKIVANENLTKFELYDLSKDWKETTDISAEHPERFAELKRRLIAHDAAVKAEGPDWWKNSQKSKKANKKKGAKGQTKKNPVKPEVAAKPQPPKKTASPKSSSVKAVLPAGVSQQLDLVYARRGTREMKLDLFAPKTGDGPFPALVFVHGGGWFKGDKSKYRPMAQRLAARGYVSACIEYRLAGEASFPAAIHDCKSSLRWLRAHAKELRVDTTRIGIVGGSAGGHLAGLVATSGRASSLEGPGNRGHSSAVQAAVIMAGPMDLASESFVSKAMADPRRRVINFLGGTYEKAPATYAAASPIFHLDAATPPCLFMDGEKDRPGERYVEMRKQMDALGIENQFVIIKDGPHPFWQRNPWIEPTLEHLDTFFKKHLAKQQAY